MVMIVAIATDDHGQLGLTRAKMARGSSVDSKMFGRVRSSISLVRPSSRSTHIPPKAEPNCAMLQVITVIECDTFFDTFFVCVMTTNYGRLDRAVGPGITARARKCYLHTLLLHPTVISLHERYLFLFLSNCL